MRKSWVLVVGVVLLMGIAPFEEELESGDGVPGSGEATRELRLADHAEGRRFQDHWWRGYAFEVSRETRITHLVGGTNSNCARGFRGAIYEATWQGAAGEGAIEVGALLGAVRYEPRETLGFRAPEFEGQKMALEEAVRLEPGKTYFLAQGRMGRTGFVCHFSARGVDRGELLGAHGVLKSWYPEAGTFVIHGTQTAQTLVGQSVGERSETEVLVGFEYVSGMREFAGR